MKIFSFLFIFFMNAHLWAHSMPESVKKEVIINSLKNVTEAKIDPKQIEISSSYISSSLNFFGSLVQGHEGDKDFEKFKVEYSINYDDTEDSFTIECDIITGEITGSGNLALYYIVYKNCLQTNLTSYLEKRFSLPNVSWNEWKYQAILSE